MIVAFMGSEPPEGWLLCDGSPLPDGEQYNDLRKMIGDTLPTAELLASSHNISVSRSVGYSSGEKSQGHSQVDLTIGSSQVSHSQMNCTTQKTPALKFIIKV